jgi:hypothetical protein
MSTFIARMFHALQEIKTFDSSALRASDTKVSEAFVVDSSSTKTTKEPDQKERTIEDKDKHHRFRDEPQSWLGGFQACGERTRAEHEKHLAETKAKSIPNAKFAIQLENVLTPEECNYLIDQCEKKGFEPALLNVGFGREVLDTAVRNNLRCMHDDRDLCGELWRRLQPFVENVRSEGYDYKRCCELRPRELNERLRVLKYTSEPGNPNYFKAHFDGSYARPKNHPHYPDVSKLTVLIYLNGGIEGGCTRVFNEDKFYDCIPSTGRVLIHDHAILHEGTPVVEGTGTKYVIRTDIMCTIIPDDSR